MVMLYHEPLGPHAACGMYIRSTSGALCWPPPCTPAAREERARFVYGALRMALTLDERGLLRDDSDTGWPATLAEDGTPVPPPPPKGAEERSLDEITLAEHLRPPAGRARARAADAAASDMRAVTR
jgi:hypothetical protein